MQSARWGHGVALAAAVLAVALAVPSAASSSSRAAAPSGVVLPGAAAAAGVRQAAHSWIVGGRPSASTRRLAQRFGAQSVVPGAGVYRVARVRARAFAGALQAARLLTFAEPDALMRRQAFPWDPLTPQQWALPAIRATSLTPPPVTASSPTLAIMEDDIDLKHPEFIGAPISLTRRPVRGFHGTAVTSVAAAPDNGRGMVGVWPGMKVLIGPSPQGTCSAAMRAIATVVRRGVAVINMSYGFEKGECHAHRIATNAAYGAGTVLVAAAGNEFEEGNPSDQSPSADPHVITVAALKQNLSAADFSNAHNGVDVSAPGVGVLAAVPLGTDEDGIKDADQNGVKDGYAGVDGTSFSSPMVAAATTWVAAMRPGLHHTQLTDLVRYSPRDLGRRGWDRRFGFGILDLPAALSDPAPAPDPLEPNDEVRWVDGTHFQADRPISRGRGLSRLRARLDSLDDPADVYRVFVPARRSVRIAVAPSYGDPDLKVYSHRARGRSSRGRLIARSRRAGGRRDRLTLTNYAHGRRLVYVVVYPDTTDTLDAEYRLSVRGIRFTSRGRALQRRVLQRRALPCLARSARSLPRPLARTSC